MWWDSRIEDYRREVRAFAETHVAPVVRTMDETSTFDDGLLRRLKEQGFVALLCPREYGGLQRDTLSYAVAVEELSRICGSTGITIAAANSLGVYPISAFASDAQREMVLPGVAEHGDMIAFGLTEPGAGSDSGGTKTNAVRDGDGWLINGSKCFITNSHFAEWIITTAVTDPGEGARGISSFLLRKDTPGFSVGKREHKLGLHGSDTATLHFEDVRVPADAIVGPRGHGFKQFMQTLDGGRISIGAMALGLAQGAFEIAVRYAYEQLGIRGGVDDVQSIQWKLSDMATRIEAARHLVYDAAFLKDHGKPFARQSAMAKLYASETGSFCAYQAIRILGAEGTLACNHVERHFRDVKLCEIGEGTSEIQRIVISRYILKEFERILAASAQPAPGLQEAPT